MDFTSSGIDDRITALEEEVVHLKDQRVETAILMVTCAERLEQLDQSYVVLSQTFNDLFISFPNLIADAKKRKEMARVETEEKAT